MRGMENSFSHHKRKDVDVSQGPPRERKGDVMRNPGVISTPPRKKKRRTSIRQLLSIPASCRGENAPSSSRQGTHVVGPLDFMSELVLHNSFSWIF